MQGIQWHGNIVRDTVDHSKDIVHFASLCITIIIHWALKMESIIRKNDKEKLGFNVVTKKADFYDEMPACWDVSYYFKGAGRFDEHTWKSYQDQYTCKVRHARCPPNDQFQIHRCTRHPRLEVSISLIRYSFQAKHELVQKYSSQNRTACSNLRRRLNRNIWLQEKPTLFMQVGCKQCIT